jgi:hypothetical protein
MRNIYILWFALLIISRSNAQSHEVWYSGSITLADNHVLVGRLSNMRSGNFVVFQSQEGKKTILAHKINSYRYYDSISNINRQFVSVKDTGPFQQWRLYEIVLQGKAKVLRQPKWMATSYSLYALHEINDYNYFIWHDAELIPMKKFRVLLYPKLIQENRIELEQFIATSHLNINEMKSTLLILKVYNQLQGKSPLVANLN